jgi:hypothetical protein
MKWIKEYFIKRALNKKRETPAKRDLTQFQHIKTICVLAETKDEIHEINEVITSFMGESVLVYSWYFDKTADDEQAVSDKDFTLLGKPGEKLTQFLSLSPDLIIFTVEKQNYFALYLLHLKPEPYRIGFYSEMLKPYLDLMLDKEGKDTRSGTEQLLKYLKQIN